MGKEILNNKYKSLKELPLIEKKQYIQAKNNMKKLLDDLYIYLVINSTKKEIEAIEEAIIFNNGIIKYYEEQNKKNLKEELKIVEKYINYKYAL